jgi:hypothetical protein
MLLNRQRAQTYLQTFDFGSLFIEELGWDTVDRVTLPFEIDRVLAQHYGFTTEEPDFIINYDIKYRRERDSGGDD